MALDVDGFAVLRAIVQDPDAFGAIRTEATKAARALVTKQLKAKTLTVDGLKRVRTALGDHPFALVVDGLSDADVKSITSRLDKHHPDLKSASASWRRGHMVALAKDVEPSVKPPRRTSSAKRSAPKPRAPGTPAIERALNSRAMAAVWDGKNVDDEPEAAAQKPAGKRSAPRR